MSRVRNGRVIVRQVSDDEIILNLQEIPAKLVRRTLLYQIVKYMV